MNRADERRWRELGNDLLAEIRGLNSTLLALQKEVRSLRNQQETANEHHQQERQQPQFLHAELQVPEAVQRDKRASDNRQFSVQLGLAIVTFLAFVAAAFYAAVAHSQLHEMRIANNMASDSFAKTIGQMQAQTVAANTENAQAANADRPWLGTSLNVDGFEVGKIPVATIVATNTGRRPAKIIISQASSHWFVAFPDNPPYKQRLKSRNIVVPNGFLINRFNTAKNALSPAEIATAATGKPAKYFIYSDIEYIDVGTGIRHYTHSCWTYIGNDPSLPSGFYNCTEYEDAQ